MIWCDFDHVLGDEDMMRRPHLGHGGLDVVERRPLGRVVRGRRGRGEHLRVVDQVAVGVGSWRREAQLVKDRALLAGSAVTPALQ